MLCALCKHRGKGGAVVGGVESGALGSGRGDKVGGVEVGRGVGIRGLGSRCCSWFEITLKKSCS